MSDLRCAMITGATSGIGESTARLLAQKSYSLVITGRRKNRLDKLKEELVSKYNIDVLSLSFDVRNHSEVRDVLGQHFEALKKVSVLVNNAGLAKGIEPFSEAKISDWEQMIDTNVKGLLYMTKYMIPLLKKHKLSDIINIGSVAGRWSYPGGGVYCGTKHAVLAISESLRMDLMGSSIRVCCVEPGMVDTEFSLVRLEDPKKAAQVYKNMTPLHPDDIAENILWILNRPEHVNIQEIVVFPKDQASVTQVHRK